MSRVRLICIISAISVICIISVISVISMIRRIRLGFNLFILTLQILIESTTFCPHFYCCFILL